MVFWVVIDGWWSEIILLSGQYVCEFVNMPPYLWMI